MKRVSICFALVIALSGCAGDSGPVEIEDDVPDEIRREQIEEVAADLAAKFPRRFAFPGQELLEDVRMVINDTVSQGDGAASVELPRDVTVCAPDPAASVCTGSDINPTYIRYDVSDQVPIGQPVEMRIKLKWWGNPGSASDMDIFVDVPGMRGAHDPDSFDESNNWNIVTKFLVVNTVRVDGQPFDVGVQVSNGRVLSEEMPYSLRVDFTFGKDILAPGVAYGVTVPQNASRLVFESEPLGGDEHITGEFLVIDPTGRLLRHVPYDDIGVDARVVATPRAGEYVLYAPVLRGGFLRVLSDVPNEAFEARMLPMELRSGTLASGVLPPVGGAGTFDVDSFPLTMDAWLAATDPSPAGVAGQAALNITVEGAWVATTSVTGSVSGEQFGRVGPRIESQHDYSHLRLGTYDWTVEGSAAVAMDAGYSYWTFTR